METIAEQGKLINKLLKLREEFFQQLQTMFTKYFPGKEVFFFLALLSTNDF